MPFFTLPSRFLPFACLEAPPSPPTHRPADLAPTLRAVLDALPKPDTGTAAGRRLRKEVERHLKDLERGGPLDHRVFPSAALAYEWLERARFDLAINPDALYRLHHAGRDFEKQWKALELPTDHRLYRTFQTLAREIEDGLRFPKKQRLDIPHVMAFDARLEDLQAQTRHLVDQHDARVVAAVRPQQPPNASLRSARPPGARSPAPG